MNEEMKDADSDVIMSSTEEAHPGPNLATFCLARVVDDIVRDMRKRGVPAKRWATFVHVGV